MEGQQDRGGRNFETQLEVILANTILVLLSKNKLCYLPTLLANKFSGFNFPHINYIWNVTLKAIVYKVDNLAVVKVSLR